MKEFLIDSPWEARGDEACYVGGIALSRGLAQMVEACGLARVPLNLAGPRDPGAMEVLERLPAWRGVRDLGILNRRGVSDLLARVRIGLVTLSPEPNIVESLPVKLFEYMAAGVPVVASNFPLWKEIVEGNECGFCVDPRDTAAVAGAIRKIIGSPGEARRMGQNGQRAVKDVYSWSREEIKLLALYQSIVGAC
jgi:glycosyltransferase involved in cell wall biosynthesis